MKLDIIKIAFKVSKVEDIHCGICFNEEKIKDPPLAIGIAENENSTFSFCEKHKRRAFVLAGIYRDLN
jgi:hypothetical protein